MRAAAARSAWGREALILARYAGAGLLNTAVGLSGTFVALLLGAPPELANVFGYAAGLMFGFFIMKNFVFQAKGRFGGDAARFAAAFLVAFSVNIVVLRIMLAHGSYVYLAQICAMASYTVLMYVFTRLFVFKRKTEKT